MIKDDYLIFLNDVSKNKPNDFDNNKKNECPFCSRKKLNNIILEDGPFIFLRNKYHTLLDTEQFIIVETYTCDAHMGKYSEAYMQKLMKFALRQYLNMEESNNYKSVILYKNHGKNSGGSLKHSHMQIIGLNNIDYKNNITKDNFSGIIIYDKNNCIVNLSQKPINAFCEFNIIMYDDLKEIDEFSICVLKCVKYILYDYFAPCDSFNLFFYHYDKKLICKVCPRFVTSPLILGYKIKQVSNCCDIIAEKLKKLYFE